MKNEIIKQIATETKSTKSREIESLQFLVRDKLQRERVKNPKSEKMKNSAE